MFMFISEKRKGDIKILELNGKIQDAIEEFDSTMHELVEGQTKIIIDCNALNFINSTGLRVFLSALKDVVANNGKVVICNLNNDIREIFQISGFHTLFEFYESTDEAIESFG